MTNDIRALTVGSAEIYINGEKCGWATDVEIEKRVETIRHESNVGVEFATDHILPVRRSFHVRGRFGEINPPVVNGALGLSGITGIPVGTAQPKTEYARLYPARWHTLMRKAESGSLTVKSADESVTFAAGDDYELNQALTAIRMKTDGDIPAGALLKVEYSHLPAAGAEVKFAAPGKVTPVHMILLHRYPDGESLLEITLPKVSLEADVKLAFDEKDWIGIPFEGECLPDESAADAPFGSQRFFGPVFANQTDSAADAPDNPYVPEYGMVN